MGKITGKVREICQSDNVGNLALVTIYRIAFEYGTPSFSEPQNV